MTDVARHELEAVMQGCGRNLEVGICERHPKAVKAPVDPVNGARDGSIAA